MRILILKFVCLCLLDWVFWNVGWLLSYVELGNVNVTRRPGLVSSADMSSDQPAWVRVDAYVSVRERWLRKVKVLDMMSRIAAGGWGGGCSESTFAARRACIQAFCWNWTVVRFLRRMLACHLVSLLERVGRGVSVRR